MFLFMIRSRILRLEAVQPDLLGRLSDAELCGRIARSWAALCGGQVPLGDVDGLIEYLAEVEGGTVDEEFASMMRRGAWVFDHQISPE